MKATLTHNNAYDAIVIQDDDGDIVTAAQIDSGIFKDFIAENVDNLEDWSFSSPYSLDLLDDVDDYGDAYVARENGGEIVILDDDLYMSRKDFFVR